MDMDDDYVPQISQMDFMMDSSNNPGGSMSNGQQPSQHQQQPYCSGGMNAMNYYESNGTNALNAMQQMTNMYASAPQQQQQQQHQQQQNGPPPGYIQHQQMMMAQQQAHMRAQQQHQQQQQQQVVAPPPPQPPAKKTRQRKSKKGQAAVEQENAPQQQQQQSMSQPAGYGYMGPTPPHMVHPGQQVPMRYPQPNSYDYAHQQQQWPGQQYPGHMQPPQAVPPGYRPITPGQPPNGSQYGPPGNYPNPQIPPQQNYYQQPQIRPPYYGNSQASQPTTSQTTPGYPPSYPPQIPAATRYPQPGSANPPQQQQQLPAQPGYNNNYGMDPNGYYQHQQQQPSSSTPGYSKQQNSTTPQPSSVPPPGYPSVPQQHQQPQPVPQQQQPLPQQQQPQQQQQQMPNRGYGPPSMPGAPPNYMPPQQIQYEMMECERHMQYLMQQPRTPEIQQKMDQINQKGMYLRRMAQAQQSQVMPQNSGPPSAGSYPQPSLVSPRPQSQQQQLPHPQHQQQQQMQQQHYPAPVPKQEQKPSIPTPTPSTPINAPVSVMQTSANQVQVNITPEMTGRTLISVYHQYPPAASSAASTSSGYGSKDSIPPEPVPPNVQQSQIQTSHVPPPQQYGSYQNGQQQQQQQQMTPPPQVPYHHKPEIAEQPKIVDKMMVGASEMVTGEENYPEEHRIERIENINRIESVPIQHPQIEQVQESTYPSNSVTLEPENNNPPHHQENVEQEPIKVEIDNGNASEIKDEEPNNNVDEDLDNDDEMQMELDFNPPRAPLPADMRDDNDEDEEEQEERQKTPEYLEEEEEAQHPEVETMVDIKEEEPSGIEEQGEMLSEELEPKEKTPEPSEEAIPEMEVEAELPEEEAVAPPKVESPIPEDSTITQPILESMDVEPESVAEPSASISMERDFSASNEGTPGLQSAEASEPASVIPPSVEAPSVDDSSFIDSPAVKGKKKRQPPKPRVRKTPAAKKTPAKSRKRKKESDLDDDDDEYSFDTKSTRKQKKLTQQIVAASTSAAAAGNGTGDDTEMDSYIEKRRSGRRKGEDQSYADQKMEFEQSEEEGDEREEEEETRPWKIFENVWLVEKILAVKRGMRPVVKEPTPVPSPSVKEEVDDKATVEEVSKEVEAEAETVEGDTQVEGEGEKAKEDSEAVKDKEETLLNGVEIPVDEDKKEIKIEEGEKEDKDEEMPEASEQTMEDIPEAETYKEKEDITEPEISEAKVKDEEKPTITEEAEDVPLEEVDTGKDKEEAEEAEKESAENQDKTGPILTVETEEEEIKMEEVDIFFVKYKHKSYRHCAWKSIAEMEEFDPKIAPRAKRYTMKNEYISDQILDTELYNEDFLIPDRVVDIEVEDDGTEYCLIKWHALPYEECTWEYGSEMEIDELKQYYHQWNDEIDSLKVKAPPRPDKEKFIPITPEKEYKNDNELREYQIEGVNWLLYSYFHKNNCILADEMGLGKTVQTITLLQGIYEAGIHGPFLVVVPLSTLGNWEREFETWTDMNSIVYHGGAKSRELVQNYEFYYKQTMIGKRKPVIKFDALITTFEMVVTDVEILKKFNFRVCVIDEAHRLKNRHCKLLTGGLQNFKIEHRVLLTGTPLQNNINELFSLLNFLDPEKFSCQNDFLEKFGNCQTEEQVTALQNMLKPMMLRRLKEDVEKTLQPKEETIIEVQLSNVQKKYYRAILEKNFTHLLKGNHMPSLMNTMMELRKCCNHPFLIKGAEEQIVSEFHEQNPEESEFTQNHNALIQSSGKLVLIDKLLPKLQKDGHKVLMFSQMVKVLDLIEEYLNYRQYSYERIDGNVRGDLRQAAIDRFSKKDQNKFVFLLCTRAGGLGINLVAADTVIIFDSDWNPQNDLQAQARCHRIGQTKMVKVYRLITANTYERTMFDRASLKLGLDKAVLQSMKPNANEQLSKKEVEDLLKKGAYGAVMDEDNEGSKFDEEDIDTILQRRTQTITIEPGVKGSTFAKASFKSSTNEDISIDDPDFWRKWADKAQVEVKEKGAELIVDEPRSRRRRFDDTFNNHEGSDADNGSEDEKGNRRPLRDRSGQSELRTRSGKKRRRPDDDDDDEYYAGHGNTPDELTFNKSEYFKVEKMLLAWGWGRWSLIKEKLENNLEEREIEHMARCFLLHCLREYRGDDKSRDFVWKLITPKGETVIKSDDKKDTNIFQQGWASNPEYNPPGFAIDHSFRRHVIRHTNKLIVRIHYLYLLEHEIITEKWAEKCLNPEIPHTEIDFKPPPLGEFPPNSKWDSECDKSFSIGVFRHGMENNDAIKADENLCFIEKLDDGGFLSTTDINNRFKKLLLHHIRQAEITLQNQTSIRNTIKLNAENRGNWTTDEEDDFIRVIINYGVWDQTQNDKVNIKWTKFRERASSLSKKTDVQMMENLYCVLARCSKVQNSPLGEADEVRAKILERIPAKKCSMILHRLTLMRKVHINGMTKDENFRRTHIRMIPLSNMPKGWTYELDERLFNVADTFGVNKLQKKLATLSEFKTIELPSNKELWHRLYEIVLTLENGKYGGTFDPIQYDEESDDEKQDELWQLALKNAEKQAALPSATPESSSSTVGGGGGSSRRTQNKKKANAAAAAAAASSASTPSSSSKKDINSAHQNFVKQMDQAALQQQNYLLMQAAAALSGAGAGSSGSGSGKQSSSNSASATAAANDIVAQIAQLQAILQFTNSAGGNLTNASFNKAIEDALNLSKKDTTHSTPSASTSKSSTSAATSSSQKISTPSISQKPSTSSATPAVAASSSNSASTSSQSAAASTYAQMNSTEAAAFEKAALDQLGIGFAELMVLQSLDPNSIVCMHNPETKHTVQGDKAPTLKNLETYIRKNPKYKVDFAATLSALTLPKTTASSSSKASTSKTPTQNGLSASTTNTPKVSTATAPSLPSLEPGEIPKASTSSTPSTKASTSNSASIGNEYENIQISVFSKTGATINKDKFPTIKTLQTYLDKNPDMNVTSNHAPIAKTLLPKSYHNRIGGEAELYNQMAALMALNSSMFGLGGTSAASTPAFNLSGTSAGSSSSNNNSSSAAAQQALEAQMFLLQQSMNPLMGYNYASMLANMPGMSGTGMSGGGTSLSQFTTPTSSSTKQSAAASTSAAKPSISAGTSSKSAAAAAAAANAAAATSAASNAAANNTASQMLTEAALTAEILNNPQLAQLFAMSMSGMGAGTPSTSASTSAAAAAASASAAAQAAAAQNQINAALYGMDPNQMSQIQALNMLSMLAMPVLTAQATPTPSTPAASGATKASSSNSEKKSSTAGTNSSATPIASKKSLGKIVEDLSKTPASSSSS